MSGRRRGVPPKLEVLQAAVAFRQAATAVDARPAIARCQGEAALAFLTGRKAYREAPVIWGYFFCGAVVLGGHMESARPVIAFYNPFLDAVLVTQWSRENGQPRMVAADFGIASELAGEPPARPRQARWLAQMSKQPLPDALHAQYAAYVAAFTRQYPVESTRVVDLRVSPGAAAACAAVESQAASSYTTLHALQDPDSPQYNPDIEKLRQALAAGDAAALARLLPARNPMAAAELAKQPAAVRQQAIPLYGITGQGHTLVLFAPISAPRFYLIAEWKMKPERRLEFVMPFDIDGQPPLGSEKASATGKGKP
jgi:hypothetical protein